MSLTPEAVFTPGSFPTHTYVDRNHEELEVRLLRFVLTDGMLPSVVGPSKSGKTVLAQKVVGERSLRVSGAEINAAHDLWAIALTRLGRPPERSTTTSNATGMSAEVRASDGVSILGIGSGSAGAQGGLNSQRSESATLKYAPPGMHEAIAALKDENRILFIDDFHYIEEPLKASIAQQLKEALMQSLPVLVLAVPHRGDDPIRSNPDLRGRVAAIDVGLWNVSDLVEIGQLGFPKLNLQVSAEDILSLATEALGSPQLMQALCLEAFYYWQATHFATDPNPRVLALGVPGVNAVCRKTADLTDAKTAYDLLSSGPKRHGRERTQYESTDGSEGDNYVLILRAVAEDPPRFSFPYQELLTRMGQVVREQAPAGQQISRTLVQMEEIVSEKLPNDRVLAWDEEKQVLDIVDPYFLFYLRWKVWPQRRLSFPAPEVPAS